MSKLDAVIEYCTTRLGKHRLNGVDWNQGYEFALKRILGIAETGEIYHKETEEEHRRAEIKHLRERRKALVRWTLGYKKQIEKNRVEIKEIAQRLRSLQ